MMGNTRPTKPQVESARINMESRIEFGWNTNRVRKFSKKEVSWFEVKSILPSWVNPSQVDTVESNRLDEKLVKP